MDRQKDYFSVLKKIKPNQLTNSRLIQQSQRKSIGSPVFVGKSYKNFRDNDKIIMIKNKCLPGMVKSNQIMLNSVKKQSGIKQKSYSLANQQDFDTSCILSEQEDDAELQPKSMQGTLLIPSKFKHRPNTILFRYPACCQKQHYSQILRETIKIINQTQPELCYKIYGSQYKCIVNAFECNGFKKVKDMNWTVFFDVRGSKIRSTYNKIQQGQKFNHFAGCWHLGRKDELWRNVSKQRKLFSQDYNFLPKTFIFPYDYQRFDSSRNLYDKNQLWIQKPVASSKGRNIRVLSNQAKISNRRNTLISQYIDNPHLINNLKYDLRIYVVVTSFNPLKVYIYQNGLARFATGKYKTTGKKDKFIHLTNFSVNKYSKNFIHNQKSQNPQQEYTSKWSLIKLKQYYAKIGIDYKYIFKQIQDIVIKTCIAGQGSMLAPKYRDQDKKNVGFQLFGFDILIDDKLKAWLMQVNVCPSLCSSSPLDKKIKHTLIVDLLNLIGLTMPQAKKQQQQLSPKINKQQNRKYRFKNPHNILNLTYQNCLQLLAPDDWLILFQNQEELQRMNLGNFYRAFPRKDNILQYQKFFQCSRYNNFVLWKHMLSNRSFLTKLNL